MAKFTAETFTGNIVAISVAVVVFSAVALPILGSVITEGMDPSLKAVMQAIPIFIGVGVLMACIYLFINNKKN